MSEETGAERIAGALWAAIRAARHAGGGCRHYPGALDAGWLASLPLPAAGLTVGLLDGAPGRPPHYEPGPELQEAYEARPRTQITDDAGFGNPQTWYARAAWHLTRLSGTGWVRCSFYASRHGDETMGPHRDDWLGAVIQLSGAKHWATGEVLLGGPGTPGWATTRAGDVLLIPRLLPHAVSTPVVPGQSVHVTFTLGADEPGTAPGLQARGSPAPPGCRVMAVPGARGQAGGEHQRS